MPLISGLFFHQQQDVINLVDTLCIELGSFAPVVSVDFFCKTDGKRMMYLSNLPACIFLS